MQVQSINSVYFHKYNLNKQRNNSINKHKSDNSYSYNPIAYRDYNITFSGRTPEDFYAQDFNRDNMPDTMRDYLDQDYEHRQYIPPEQMMREVYKYIDIADNFSDVKSIYPNETLFRNLHENKTNSRNSILSEIAIAKELSDTPLFKDGSDNFGMYLLKKIYLEGKTLNEINKDFFEKDINDEYKGFITKQIDYPNLSSFGISYPNGSFWHSFINTRDEYKKFFVSLPKNSEIPGVNIGSKSSSSGKTTTSDAPADKKTKRRYNIKSHQKRDIRKDIVDKKSTDIDSVRKIVAKRFGKDDPEASFIERYMSPIMAVAAERAHMSEEMRTFTEYEREKGKSGDEKTMFARFWKHNPKMLEVFSYAVTDTMDMFEDIYGDGGGIAINTDLEKITPESEKKKIIDFVNPEFLELLQYTQSIAPKREERKKLHAERQQYYDELAEKLACENVITSEPIEQNSQTHVSPIDGSVFEEKDFKDKMVFIVDGKEYNIYSNLNEELTKCVNMNFEHLLPKAYSDKYAKFLCHSKLADDKLKLSIIANNSSEDYSVIKSMLYDNETLGKMIDKINNTFMRKNQVESRAAHQAFVDMMCKYTPDLLNEVGGHIYKANPLDIPVYIANIQNRFKDADDFLNNSYKKYLTPLNNKEAKEIATKICNEIMKDYHKENSVFYRKVNNDSYGQFSEMFSAFFENGMGYEQKALRNHLQNFIVKCGGSTRALLDEQLPKELKLTFTEQLLNSFYDTNEDVLYNAFIKHPKTRRYILMSE